MITQITTQVNKQDKIFLLRLKNTLEEGISQLKDTNVNLVLKFNTDNNLEKVVQLHEYIGIKIRNAIREDNIENFSSIAISGHTRIIMPLRNNFESIATQNVFPINYETFQSVTSHRSFSFVREIRKYFWSLRRLLPIIPLLPRLLKTLVNRSRNNMPEIGLPDGVLTSLVDRLRNLSRERPRNVFSIEDIFRYIKEHLN